MGELRATSNSRGWVWAHARFTYLPESASSTTVCDAEAKSDLCPDPSGSSTEIHERPLIPEVLGTGVDGGSTKCEDHRRPRHSRNESPWDRRGQVTAAAKPPGTRVRVPSSFVDRGALTARRKLRAIFIKVIGIMILSGTLLALGFYFSEQGAANLRAGTAVVPSAFELCNALSSFAILPMERWVDSKQEGAVACRFRTPGSERALWQWSDISVTVSASPTDPNVLRDVVLEGPHASGARGTAAKRQMIWASSVIFTELGMEIPWKISDAIDHGSRAESNVEQLAITAGPRCQQPDGRSTESCRMVIQIRNQPNLQSLFSPSVMPSSGPAR